MIPAEAVEAAAAAWLAQSAKVGSWTLDGSMRAALEAAAPHLMAPVYEEGWLAARDFYLSTNGPIGGLDASPYRTAK